MNKVFCFVLLFIATFCSAQNSKHSISYVKVEFEIDSSSLLLNSNRPLEFNLHGKNDMSRVEIKYQQETRIIISDNLSQSGYILSSMKNKKVAEKINSSHYTQRNTGIAKPIIILTRDSKLIAGFNCYKAIVRRQIMNTTSEEEVWFSNEIKCKNSFGNNLPGINGMLMQYQFHDDFNNNFKVSAKKVEVEESLSDSLFRVPAGYKIIERK